MRTQVGIVGAGPAGLTLALLLHRHGIGCVVLEARDRDYVERRVRAGLLEHNTVDVLRSVGAASRLDREGLHHTGVYLRRPGHTKHVDIERLTGRHVTIYGQQEVVKDLIAAALDRGVDVRFDVSDVVLEGFDVLDGHRPSIAFTGPDGRETLDCDFIAGCDGFHGVSRASLPRLEYLDRSEAAETMFAENYAGLPATDDF